MSSTIHRTFGEPGGADGDRLEVADDSELVLLRIEGSHFLWKMVRRIVGVLVEVGRGNLPASMDTDIGVTKVVGQHNDDIRALRRGRLSNVRRGEQHAA